MTFLSELYLAAMLLLGVLALFFIFCRHYEEGIVGNAALGFVFVMALVELVDVHDKTWTAPSPAQEVLVIAIAVFVARYAVKVVWKNWGERGRWPRVRGGAS